jgi:dTDP-4-dehydrorhamnose reductase
MSELIEVWGGLECTVARIGDVFRDQVRETGHHRRLDDIDRIAGLGLRTLRYPLLWETVSPEDPEKADFAWHDERLDRLRQHGIRAIAGLCHHGSGPRYTQMLDPQWPELLARHARNVAERYPGIELYTPVNEPLTTARFSGLYGHWYPHGRSYREFLSALVAECKATVLAMREIRKVNPKAQLVQTDDLGKSFSTPMLRYQADHENERRWLTFDLLCGMVDREHGWWDVLLKHGVPQADLELLLEADAAPDIIGINHYLTSERWLDENLSRYPGHHWGGNAWHRYADAEAVRMPIPHEDLGPAARLREVWERYRRPVAVTEVHHGCSRDEQLRWLMEVWNAARTVRAEGADIRAITVWSLFGTMDWNSLLTRQDGCYEPGIYDVRGKAPRATALAKAVKALATTGGFDHPVLDRPGWWRRDIRFYSPPKSSASIRAGNAPRRILLTGADGALGRAFARIAHFRGLDLVALSHADLGGGNPDRIRRAVDHYRPWAVIDLSAHAQHPPARPADVIAAETWPLLAAAARSGAAFVALGSDQVFAGPFDKPRTESNLPDPSGAATLARAEAAVLAAHPDALVVRTGPLFGPWDNASFAWHALRDIAAGRDLSLRSEMVSPAYVPDLVHEVLNLLVDGETGVWHLANGGAVTWRGFAAMLAEAAGLASPEAPKHDESPALNRALATERGILMPTLESAVGRFVRECEMSWAPGGAQEAAE